MRPLALKDVIRFSKIIGKIGIDTFNFDLDQPKEMLGKEMISKLIDGLGVAEKEIYAFIDGLINEEDGSNKAEDMSMEDIQKFIVEFKEANPMEEIVSFFKVALFSRK